MYAPGEFRVWVFSRTGCRTAATQMWQLQRCIFYTELLTLVLLLNTNIIILSGGNPVISEGIYRSHTKKYKGIMRCFRGNIQILENVLDKII